MSGRPSIVVVGAGPAGAVAAHQIARLGGDVLLVDKARFPRSKVCGGCLSARAAAALDAMGMGLGAAGAPLGWFRLRRGGREAEVRLAGGVAIARRQLDAHLVDRAVAAGARFVDGRAVALRRRGVGGRPHVLTIGQREVDADVLVAADGLGGRLLETAEGFEEIASPRGLIGLGAVVEPRGIDPPRPAPGFAGRAGVIEMNVGPGGYVGMVGLSDGSIDVAGALDPAAVRDAGGTGAAVERVIGRPLAGPARERWRGTPRLTRRRRAVAGERLFVIGDSAGYVEPFTGEGMAWAIAGGAAVAPLAVKAAARWAPAMANDWTREHRRVVRRRQWVCKAVAAVVRRGALAGAAAGALAWSPDLAAPVLEHLGAGEVRAAGGGDP